jgi:hypothetical protein
VISLPNQPVQQIQIGRDAEGASILVTVADFFVRFAMLLTVVLSHLFYKNVVH